MFSTLLRVLPKCGGESAATWSAFDTDWSILKRHTIPSPGCVVTDDRLCFFHRSTRLWAAAFLPAMQDAAQLLRAISQQVLLSYVAMDQPPRFDDHLHQAMQRLILNYLVEHEDDPIPLTPGVLRMTALGDGTWNGRRCDLVDFGLKNT